jgi:hypothetical protein
VSSIRAPNGKGIALSAGADAQPDGLSFEARHLLPFIDQNRLNNDREWGLPRDNRQLWEKLPIPT